MWSDSFLLLSLIRKVCMWWLKMLFMGQDICTRMALWEYGNEKNCLIRGSFCEWEVRNQRKWIFPQLAGAEACSCVSHPTNLGLKWERWETFTGSKEPCFISLCSAAGLWWENQLKHSSLCHNTKESFLYHMTLAGLSLPEFSAVVVFFPSVRLLVLNGFDAQWIYSRNSLRIQTEGNLIHLCLWQYLDEMLASVVYDREGKCTWCVLKERFGCHAPALGGVHVGLLWGNSCCSPCVTPRHARAHYTLPFIPSKHGADDEYTYLVCGMTQSWAAGADRNADGNSSCENISLILHIAPRGLSFFRSIAGLHKCINLSKMQ